MADNVATLPIFVAYAEAKMAPGTVMTTVINGYWCKLLFAQVTKAATINIKGTPMWYTDHTRQVVTGDASEAINVCAYAGRLCAAAASSDNYVFVQMSGGPLDSSDYIKGVQSLAVGNPIWAHTDNMYSSCPTAAQASLGAHGYVYSLTQSGSSSHHGYWLYDL